MNEFKNFLVQEKFINALTYEDKAKIADEVWNILQDAYKDIGGFKTASTKEELINDSFLWKAVKKGGKIVAVGIYKDTDFGRKRVAIGTDKSLLGKTAVKEIMVTDLERAYVETSGPSEKFIMKHNGDKFLIPSEKVETILKGKKIEKYNPDGFHYIRRIAGEPHEKVMIGTVKNC